MYSPPEPSQQAEPEDDSDVARAESDIDASAFPEVYDKLQLDIMMGLRVVEHLGKEYSSPHVLHYKREDGLIQILNWAALFIAPHYPDRYCDIAVALSAQHGDITVHIANSSGRPPSEKERANVSLLMSILRRAITDDSNPALTTLSFLVPLVQKASPEILQKLALLQSTEKEGPQQTLRRFYSLVSFWVQYRLGGERSVGFIDMAIASGTQATDMLVLSFMNLMMDRDFTERQGIASNEKYAYLEPILTWCDLLVRSTFFDDLVNHSQYRQALDVSDLLFLHELLRGLSRIACYIRGSAEFAYRGVSYIKRVLGSDGVTKFLHNHDAGGIIVNWISNSGVQAPPKTYRWPVGPREVVAEILERDSLDLDHLDYEMREHIAQTETVQNAWKEGDSVTPHLHCELRLIRYIEQHYIAVVDHAVGTSQPTCWACHCYIKKLKSVPNWCMSHTSGKARDDWLLPPDGLDVGRVVLRALVKETERVVEEYAFDLCP